MEEKIMKNSKNLEQKVNPVSCILTYRSVGNPDYSRPEFYLNGLHKSEKRDLLINQLYASENIVKNSKIMDFYMDQLIKLKKTPNVDEIYLYLGKDMGVLDFEVLLDELNKDVIPKFVGCGCNNKKYEFCKNNNIPYLDFNCGGTKLLSEIADDIFERKNMCGSSLVGPTINYRLRNSDLQRYEKFIYAAKEGMEKEGKYPFRISKRLDIENAMPLRDIIRLKKRIFRHFSTSKIHSNLYYQSKDYGFPILDYLANYKIEKKHMLTGEEYLSNEFK